MLADLTLTSISALVVGALVLGWLVRLLVRHSRRADQRWEAVWQQVAAQLDGRYVPRAGSWWKRTSRRVEAVIGGHAVCLDHYVVSSGNTHVAYTRTRAATSSPRRLNVYREGFFSGIAKALGMQDVQVGDAAYDEQFVIKSDDEEWARRVLGQPVRASHLEDPKLLLRVDKGRVETIASGLELDVDTLVRRLRLTAALAFAVEQ